MVLSLVRDERSRKLIQPYATQLNTLNIYDYRTKHQNSQNLPPLQRLVLGFNTHGRRVALALSHNPSLILLHSKVGKEDTPSFSFCNVFCYLSWTIRLTCS